MERHQHWFTNLCRPRLHPVDLIVRLDNEGPRITNIQNTHLDFAAIYLVRKGRALHIIDGVPHGVSRGDVFVMSAGSTHAYQQNEELSLDAFYFRPSYLASVEPVLDELPGFRPELTQAPLNEPQRSTGGKWLHLPPNSFAALRPMVEEVRREWLSDTADGALLCQALFTRLVITLCRLAAETHTLQSAPREEREWIVSEAVSHLDQRYAETVRIQSLAQRLGVSPDCLTDWFSSIMGRTPRDYLRHVRLERAQHLLTTTDLPAHEVGRRVGYPDPAHFSRIFAQNIGRTPKEFRTETIR